MEAEVYGIGSAAPIVLTPWAVTLVEPTPAADGTVPIHSIRDYETFVRAVNSDFYRYVEPNPNKLQFSDMLEFAIARMFREDQKYTNTYKTVSRVERRMTPLIKAIEAKEHPLYPEPDENHAQDYYNPQELFRVAMDDLTRVTHTWYREDKIHDYRDDIRKPIEMLQFFYLFDPRGGRDRIQELSGFAQLIGMSDKLERALMDITSKDPVYRKDGLVTLRGIIGSFNMNPTLAEAVSTLKQ